MTRTLQEVVKQITPLPWKSSRNGDITGSDSELIGATYDNPDSGTHGIGEETSDFNDMYLIHSVNHFPELVAFVEMAECHCLNGTAAIKCRRCALLAKAQTILTR